MRRPVGLMLLIAGLVMGPGYFVYTRFYTGREVTDLPLEFHPGTHGRPRAVASFDLLPIMGPVTVIVNLTATHGSTLSPSDTPRNRYQVRISLAGKTVLTHAFTVRATQVEATPAEVFRQALPVMKYVAPGEYKLELIQEGEAGMEIKQATVQVRVGVKYFNTTFVAIGLGMLLAGATVLLLGP